MSEMPERIFAFRVQDNWGGTCWVRLARSIPGPITTAPEYIRADAILPEIEVLRDVLRECADDLESFVNAEYYLSDCTIHPARQYKYDRDMRPVHRARAALSGLDTEEGA